MNNFWEDYIDKKIQSKIESDSLRKLSVIEETDGRYIKINEETLLNFASNNYLDMANHPEIIEAGYHYAKKFGAGTGASRLVSGTTVCFIELEKIIADWVNKESSILFNSGYTANIGIITALADKKTVVFCDRLNHASIYDGIIQSGAVLERYNHNDLVHLTALLDKHKDNEKKIVITDTVFSMEGDRANISGIVELKSKYNFLLIVDEAHSLGVFGKKGEGLIGSENLSNDVDIIMGTLGKSVGIFGAFAGCSKKIFDYLVNFCRAFIFTTSLSPFIIGSIIKSISIIREENRGELLLKKSKYIRDTLQRDCINCGNSSTQIIPIIVGENKKSIELAEYLKTSGFFAPAIRPPTVPPGSARIRLSLMYSHNEDDINQLILVLKNWFRNIR